MAIQFERRPMETLTSPQRPARNKKMVNSDKISNSEHQIHKFWSPKISQHQKPVEEFKDTKPTRPQKSKTPQPQKKVVSFWESNPPKTNLKKNTASSLLTTNSQSMVSLNNNSQEISNFWSKQELKTTSSAVCLHEVDEKRGFTPSDVAKDPAKREFLTNLSKRIFSPSDAITTRLSRHKQVSKSFRETKQHLSLDRTLGDGSITLGQVMTPVQDPDYDTNSLKRRNPRQMYTDSAFYSPKFHPSVQEQVEMAHKLSSSLYTNDNKLSKGQEMYLKRAKKSGKWVTTNQLDDGSIIEPEIPMKNPESAPNLKLVMNPEGKMHDWSDLPEEEVPDMSQMVMVGNPDVAKALAEGMNECKGRGKVTSPNFKGNATPSCESGMPKSPQNMAGNKPSFAGGFRQVFNNRRGMFEQIVSNSGNRPNIRDKQTHKNQLSRSKTLPDMPKINDLQKNVENEEKPIISGSASLKRPCFQSPPSPLVPKRTSSKQMVAKMSIVDGNDSIRRPLRNFFYND